MTMLYVFDFDGVTYRNTDACHQRILGVTASVNSAFTGASFEESIVACGTSWANHRDGFHHLIKDKKLHYSAHKQAARIYRDDVHGIPQPHIVEKIRKLSDHAHVCIMSHSMTGTLRMMMTRMGFSPAFTQYHAFGMDMLGGGEGWARKDDPNSGVYEWICEKYKTDPTDALMTEDTAPNLIGAKAIGMQTVHIHWGKPNTAQYIDRSYFQTVDFLNDELGIAPFMLDKQKALKI